MIESFSSPTPRADRDPARLEAAEYLVELLVVDAPDLGERARVGLAVPISGHERGSGEGDRSQLLRELEELTRARMVGAPDQAKEIPR